MKFTVIVKEDKKDGGYYAIVPELKGCFTQADTLDELKESVVEAIELTLGDREDYEDEFFAVWQMEIEKDATYANN